MAITLTETAAKEVKDLIAKQQEDDGDPKALFLRVGVKGGGCSGFNFSLELTESKTEQDEEWKYDDVTVLCDSRSAVYLNGTTIDFQDGLQGRGFVFDNPNSTSVCGCGSSFSV